MKFYKNKHELPLRLKPGDKAFLRLHEGYRLEGHLNNKINRQREGLVTIWEKIGRNAYRINVPTGMKIHDVVTAHQLEPMPDGEDLYHRDFPQRRLNVVDNEVRDTFQAFKYIVRRRVNKTTGAFKYLVKWEDEPHTHNTWIPSSHMGTAKEMRQDYDDEHPVTAYESRLQHKIRSQRAKQRAHQRHLPGTARATDGDLDPDTRADSDRDAQARDEPPPENHPQHESPGKETDRDVTPQDQDMARLDTQDSNGEPPIRRSGRKRTMTWKAAQPFKL